MDSFREVLAAGRAIPSFCTANPLVLRAILAACSHRGVPALIEATANQVNQLGGYTGMVPGDFAAMVRALAREAGLAEGQLILGGDHLGPLPWQGEDAPSAMAKAEALVAAFAEAGFGKLHLDTSMALGSDDRSAPLADETVARRGARLARAALAAWPGPGMPSFVIGSEVPVPGGAQSEEEGLSPTAPEAFEATVETYRRVFREEGLEQALGCVAAVVVQPGVEFSASGIHTYDSQRATGLMAALKGHPGLWFEGHSTDYQPVESLSAMARDGVRILKVGPELTFALREALFGMSAIEEALLPRQARSGFPQALEAAMVARPGHWQQHYCGSAEQQALMRRYSLSDRCRYYLSDPAVTAATQRLLDNLGATPVPWGLLRQHLPHCCGPVPRTAVHDPAQLLEAHLSATVLDRYLSI